MANTSPERSPERETLNGQTSLNELPLEYSSGLDMSLTTDSTQTLPVSSAHQVVTVTADDKQNGEQDVLNGNAENEQGNVEKSSLTLITSDREKVTKTESKQENALPVKLRSKHVRICAEAIEASISKETTRNEKISTSKGKSRAVSAPEVEILDEKTNPESEDNSVDSSFEGINLHESYDAAELLSSLQDQHLDNSWNSSSFAGKQHLQGSHNTPKPLPSAKKFNRVNAAHVSRKPSVSPSVSDSSSRKEHTIVYRFSEHDFSRRPSKGSKKYASPALDPIRKKEASKSPKSKSPTSTITKQSGTRNNSQTRSTKTSVPEKDRLEEELIRNLVKERKMLYNALSQYCNKLKTKKTEGSVQTGTGLCDEKPEAQPEPMTNMLRSTTATQMSNRPSILEIPPLFREDVGRKMESPSSESEVRLPSAKDKNISQAARKMYSSLKSLKKAIHLSECLCFHSGDTLDESLSQRSFKKFMDSENEIEVFQNMESMLGTTMDDIKAYLSHLQTANLISPDSFEKTLEGNDTGAKETSKIDDTSSTQIARQKTRTLYTCHSRKSILKDALENVNLNRIPTDPIISKDSTLRAVPEAPIFLSTYFVPDTNLVIQRAQCYGHMYQTEFTASEAAGPFLGITKTKTEYMGQPAPLSLDVVLNSIHRCAGCIDIRLACSCVWTRQSKRYMREFLEDYLDKGLRPGTELSRLKLFKMERTLKKINVFAGISKSIAEDLIEIVNKLHFCMQKSRILLTKKFKGEDLEGFGDENSSSDSLLKEVKVQRTTAENLFSPEVSETDLVHMDSASSMEKLYAKLETQLSQRENNSRGENDISVGILMQIVADIHQSIDKVHSLAERYGKKIQMPGRKAKRVVRFLETTLSQLGFTKDVHFGSLVAMFLSAVDKLSFFDDLLCEQKSEIRAKIHKMCLKIIRKLYDLRASLCIEVSWSKNLAKNSYAKLQEINEIKRLKQMKKKDKGFNETIEFVRGSDRSLKASIC